MEQHQSLTKLRIQGTELAGGETEKILRSNSPGLKFFSVKSVQGPGVPGGVEEYRTRLGSVAGWGKRNYYERKSRVWAF